MLTALILAAQDLDDDGDGINLDRGDLWLVVVVLLIILLAIVIYNQFPRR